MDTMFTLDGIREAVNWFWKNVGDRQVFAFHGEMGAGKTTFIQALCAHRGTRDTMGSPTFSIINQYEASAPDGQPFTIYHMDLYRLKDEEEARNAGVEDCIYSGEICFVEWPERAPGIFPPETLHVYLEVVDSHTRTLRIAGN